MAVLSGKVAVITGASKGIGRAVAKRLAADGASVVINYNSDSKAADEVVAEIGSDRAIAVKANISKVAEAETLVNAAVQKFGKIDIIMPNAGLMGQAPLEQVTEEEYDRHFDLNVKGAIFLVQKAVPHIPEGGRVIFVSTGVTSWSSVTPGYLLYAATKGAIEQFTRVLSKDLAKKGINVNALAPGPTATDLFLAGKSEQLLTHMRSLSPFNRIGTPEEQAAVVSFLASPDASWVSGQILRVNGGTMV